MVLKAEILGSQNPTLQSNNLNSVKYWDFRLSILFFKSIGLSFSYSVELFVQAMERLVCKSLVIKIVCCFFKPLKTL
jgi:hypothetical protein